MVGESTRGVMTSPAASPGSAQLSSLCVFQVGHIENEPRRRGVFPVTFVHFITD